MDRQRRPERDQTGMAWDHQPAQLETANTSQADGGNGWGREWALAACRS